MRNYLYKFNLSNKIIFFLILFFLVFILTFINNYYFYSHVERTSIRNGVQLEKTLVTYINNNLKKDKNFMNNDLLSFIKTWSNYSYYNKSLKIIDLNNKIHMVKKPDAWDYTSYTFLEINLKELLEKKKNSFIVTSEIDFKQVFISVIKSMTFSIEDLYNDFTEITKSKMDGQVIKVEDKKKKKYDGIININGNIYKDIKGAKNIVILNQNTFEKEEYFVHAFNNLKVTEGMYIKKGEIIAEGTIYSVLNNFVSSYWYRSRPFVGFTIFGFLLIFLFLKRAKSLEEKHLQEVKVIEDELVNLEEEVLKNIKEKEELLTTQNRIKEEYDSVCSKFKEYEDFVKFAFVDVTIDEMLEKNTRVLGTMFRLIAEKIVFSIYELNVGDIHRNPNLDKCLGSIKDIGILSKESINSLYAVKQFGNQSSHYTKGTGDVSLAKTIIIAKDLVNVIDEFLLKTKDTPIQIKNTKSELKNG